MARARCMTPTDKARVKSVMSMKRPVGSASRDVAVASLDELLTGLARAKSRPKGPVKAFLSGEPFDGYIGRVDRPKHLLSVDTIVDDARRKRTAISDYAKKKRERFAKLYPDARVHTVIVDKRGGGYRIYHKEGVGDFKFENMDELPSSAKLGQSMEKVEEGQEFKPIPTPEVVKKTKKKPGRPKGKKTKVDDETTGADLPDDIPEITPSEFLQLRKDVIDTREREIIDRYFDGSQAEYNKANKALKETMADASVFVRVDDQALKRIVKDTRFKTQFETGTSGGLLDHDLRYRMERALFGIGERMPGKQRPVYGYVSGSANGDTFKKTVNQYGRFRIRLKPGVKAKTTITGNDSLNVLDKFDLQPGQVPTPISDPKAVSFIRYRDLEKYTERRGEFIHEMIIEPDGSEARNSAFAIKRLAKKKTTKSRFDTLEKNSYNYIEAQIQGGVKASDIDSIHLGSHNWFGDVPDVPPEVKRWAKKNGVKIYYGEYEKGKSGEIWKELEL